MSRRESGRAFTLIEVLVVVAIIAVLIAILLPSLAEARRQAKTVVCRGNLHDLGLAFTLYAATSRGFFTLTPAPGSDTFYSLYKAKSLRQPDVLICPASRNRVRPETLNWPEINQLSQPGVWVSPENPSHVIPHRRLNNRPSDIDEAALARDDDTGGHSYENNAVYDDDRWNGVPVHRLAYKHKRMDHFVLPPQQMMLVHDNDDRYEGPPNPALDCTTSLFTNGNNCPQNWDNHGVGGMNMLFADGHAEWLKKLTAELIDYRDTNPAGAPPQPIRSTNGTIDRVWLKSQYPWRYRR